MRIFQKRFDRYRDSLFTFLAQDAIPWENNMAERAILQLAMAQEWRVTVAVKVNGQEVYREDGIELKCGTLQGKFEDLGNQPDGQTFRVEQSDKKIRLKAGDRIEMSVEHVGVGKQVHWGVSVGCSLLVSGRASAVSLGYSPDVFFENQKIRFIRLTRTSSDVIRRA